MSNLTGDGTDKFSLVVGGPFHASLRRFGLIGTDGLPTPLAAVSLASLAWLLPAMLVIAQSIADTGYAGWGFFTDWTVYTRYLIAIWVLIATERYADGRIAMLIEQFRAANLLKADDRHAFETLLDTTDRRSSSLLAEVIIACAALVWSGLSAHYKVALAGSGGFLCGQSYSDVFHGCRYSSCPCTRIAARGSVSWQSIPVSSAVLFSH